MIDLPEGYNPVSSPPPEQWLEVIDNNGNTAIATPTWYSFILQGGKVQDVEPYWDGWLIEANKDWKNPVDKIIGWKIIPDQEEFYLRST